MTQTAWSDDRIATLKRLWLDGLSASQVATQLGGVTRNAVIGKVHRLGLSGRVGSSPPIRIAKRPKRRPPTGRCVSRPKLGRSPPLPLPKPKAVDGPGLVHSMAALGVHACKWPIGDPKAEDFSFCGRAADGVYCSGHAAVAYRAGKSARLDRDPVVRRVLAGLAA